METIVQDQSAERTYYYGKCANGQGIKFHTGHEVVPYTRDDSIYAVKTHCGNQIFQENEGQRPPDVPTDELCKSCYRSFAWSEMQKALEHKRQVEDEVAAKLDDLAAQVESNDMNTIGVVRALHSMSEHLRHRVQTVSGAEQKSHLKLVSNGGTT